MGKLGLRERVEQFASLQAAHRALARSVHPSELAVVREQSRRLLIRLQGLSAEIQKAEAQPGSEFVSFDHIDRGLEDHSLRTLEVIGHIELAQLRASIPLLSRQYPDEVQGLIDVMLDGDLTNDKHLRTLEYLITMLAAEERGGRRVAVQDPSHVSPKLHRLPAHRLNASEEECLVAERVLEEATAGVLRNDDIGEIRDRVRRYKEEIGSGILDPKVLAAAVHYNVAMWNQVAAEIDSSRGMEILADGLFDFEEEDVLATTVAPVSEVLSSKAFTGLVAAFRARITGTAAPGEAVGRIAAEFPLTALRAEDIEIFESDESDEATWLMEAAIVLGLILRHPENARDEIEALGIAPEMLENEGVDELMERMAELARKRFAEGNYGSAFHISDVKMHSLATHAAMRRSPAAGAATAAEGSARLLEIEDASASGSGGLLSRLIDVLPSSPVLFCLLLIAALLVSPPLIQMQEAADDSVAVAQLSEVSPFLDSGDYTEGAVPRRWVGLVNPTWAYVGTVDRREVAGEIGEHFASLGVPHVVLRDESGQVVARYVDGELESLMPREGE